MSTRTLARLAVIGALAAVSIACTPAAGRVAPGPAMPARDTVVISDSPYAAYVGAPITLGARVWRDGTVDPQASVEWSASPATVARIDGDGRLLPLSEGHVTIVARAAGVRTKRTLQVQRNPVRRIGIATIRAEPVAVAATP